MNNIGHFVPSSFRKCIYLNTCYSYAHFIVYFVSTRCVRKVIRHFQETQVSVQQITGHFVDVKIKHLLVLKKLHGMLMKDTNLTEISVSPCNELRSSQTRITSSIR